MNVKMHALRFGAGFVLADTGEQTTAFNFDVRRKQLSDGYKSLLLTVHADLEKTSHLSEVVADGDL